MQEASSLADAEGSERPAGDDEGIGDFAEEPLSAGEQQQLDDAEDGGALLGTFSFGTLRVAFGEAVESPVRPTNAIPPHAPNEGQREFLCDMVEHALGAYGDQADSGDAAADHWQTVRRVFLVGVRWNRAKRLNLIGFELGRQLDTLRDLYYAT